MGSEYMGSLPDPMPIHNRATVPLAPAQTPQQQPYGNGSSFLQILPAPIGPFLSGNVPLGPYSFPMFLLVLVAESLLMLAFFAHVTGKLRGQGASTPALARQNGGEVQEAEVPTYV